MSIRRQLDSLEKIEKHLSVKKALLLDKALKSSNPSDIIRASNVISTSVPQKEDSNRKSYLIDPYQISSFLGYKNKSYSLSYNMLKRISYSVPIVRSIINTRINQIASFCEPQRDKYNIGFIIRKKSNIYDNNKKEPTKEELKKCEMITEFIMNCGVSNRWGYDDFDDFIRKIMNDSYMYDQYTYEVEFSKRNKPVAFYAVDASTMRISDSLNAEDEPEFLGGNRIYNKKEVRGYKPAYCQLKDNTVFAEFYPWEMCFGIRNPTTDIYNYGYGISEIEILINVVTSMLWGDEYNRKFFSQGSSPKGFFKIKNGTASIGDTRLTEFKQQWQAMMAGVSNSHKTAVFEGDVDWIDLQHTNRDMEFSKWQEYLIKTACAIFSIDPAEVNFPLSGGSEQKAMFEGNNEARIKHSKDKGLYPALRNLQRKLNRHIVSLIDPEYELVFVGMDGVNINDELDQDVKMLGNFKTIDEIRIRRGDQPLGEKNGGNVIANSIWMQWYNQKKQEEQQQQQQADGMQDGPPEGFDNEDGGQQQYSEDENPFDVNPDDESSYDEEDNPFQKAWSSFIENINKD